MDPDGPGPALFDLSPASRPVEPFSINLYGRVHRGNLLDLTAELRKNLLDRFRIQSRNRLTGDNLTGSVASVGRFA
jgi:hypothetical protein